MPTACRNFRSVSVAFYLHRAAVGDAALAVGVTRVNNEYANLGCHLPALTSSLAVPLVQRSVITIMAIAHSTIHCYIRRISTRYKVRPGTISVTLAASRRPVVLTA